MSSADRARPYALWNLTAEIAVSDVFILTTLGALRWRLGGLQGVNSPCCGIDHRQRQRNPTRSSISQNSAGENESAGVFGTGT